MIEYRKLKMEYSKLEKNYNNTSKERLTYKMSKLQYVQNPGLWRDKNPYHYRFINNDFKIVCNAR